MKTIHKYIFCLLIPILLGSCNNDGDMVVLADVQQGELSTSDTAIVLTSATSSSKIVDLNWTIEALSINDTTKYGLATTARTNVLQFDTNLSFNNPKEIVVSSDSLSFTGSELNTFVLSMELKAGIATKIYSRLKSSIGPNMQSLFSNTISISVTPYDIISYLYLPGDPSGGWDKYTTKLCSRASNGQYEGYVQAAQWGNFKFTTEADGSGVFYGSSPTLGLSTLHSSTDQWNIWFDEAGYFLIKANTNTLTWSKTAINSFNIAGDFNNWSTTNNPLTYNAETKLWTATCNFQPGEWGNTFQIVANNDWVIVYGDNSANGELKAGEKISINTPGSYTVTMDLSNPLKYTYSIK